MKIRLLVFSSVLGVLFFAALSAHADTILVRAKIPFDFNVGKSVLPAGDYTVVRMDTRAILLRSDDGTHAIYSATIPLQPKSSDEGARFVFNRYGSNTYFLEDIVIGALQTGFQLPQSKHEREMMAQGAPTRIEVAQATR